MGTKQTTRQRHKAVLQPNTTKDAFEIIDIRPAPSPANDEAAKVVFITDEAKMAGREYRGVYRRKPLTCAEIRDYARLARYGSEEMKDLTRYKMWERPQPSRGANGQFN